VGRSRHRTSDGEAVKEQALLLNGEAHRPLTCFIRWHRRPSFSLSSIATATLRLNSELLDRYSAFDAD
jgi:hypothetical protein